MATPSACAYTVIVGFVTTWPFFTMLPDALSIGGGIAVSSPVVGVIFALRYTIYGYAK